MPLPSSLQNEEKEVKRLSSIIMPLEIVVAVFNTMFSGFKVNLLESKF